MLIPNKLHRCLAFSSFAEIFVVSDTYVNENTAVMIYAPRVELNV